MTFNKILLFIHGMLFAVLIFLGLSWQFENALYKKILSKVNLKNSSQVEKVIQIQNATFDLLNPRLKFFGGNETLAIKDYFLRSADIQLLDGGACGTHVHVLGRLLQEAGVKFRIAQMRCGDRWACHVVLEAKVETGYVVLDPLYNLAFKKIDGSLASFRDVSKDFEFYKKQLPKGYDPTYKYEAVRYTNWDKIPVIMPISKTFLKLVLGNDAETFSARAYVLNLYRTYFIAILFLWFTIITSHIYLLRKKPWLIN